MSGKTFPDKFEEWSQQVKPFNGVGIQIIGNPILQILEGEVNSSPTPFRKPVNKSLNIYNLTSQKI